MDFVGTALPLEDSDIEAAAVDLGCDRAVIMAVCQVETGGLGGFLPDKRPRMLFEAHIFSSLTGGAFDAAHPQISAPSWNPKLYEGGAAEYGRLAVALGLAREAALEAASWGMFQVLGRNAHDVGYANVDLFVRSMEISEGEHLEAFVAFVQRNGLQLALRLHDWQTFARRYNGPGFATNGYDRKLASAWSKLTAAGPGEQGDYYHGLEGSLHIGDTGAAITALQQKLVQAGYALGQVDGRFGPGTEIALLKWQVDMHLTPDGIANPATLHLLGIG